NNGDLAIFNLTSGAATIIPVATIGDAVFQGTVQITADSKSLILVNNAGSLLVFDIGTNPLSPALLTTITGSTPSNPPNLNAPSFTNFRVVDSNLFAFDSNQNILQAFHFDRSVTPANFAQICSFVVPGHANLFSSGLAVTRDGNLIYVALGEDDAMAVLSVPQFLANGLTGNGPTPLITSIGVGLEPSAVVISPRKALLADLALAVTAQPTTVTAGTPVQYTITITNNGPSAATGVMMTDVLPFGIGGTPATVITPSQGSCTASTGTVSCDLGSLANGGTATGSISGATTGNPTGTLVNTPSVTANETDPNPANNSATVNITVTAASVCLPSTTIRWAGPANTDSQWTTASNWSPARVPLATDDVCI